MLTLPGCFVLCAAVLDSNIHGKCVGELVTKNVFRCVDALQCHVVLYVSVQLAKLFLVQVAG